MSQEFQSVPQEQNRETILNRIDGVIASKVIEKQGVIDEVHILVDKTKSPKQVSRDVQSIFAAYFDEELDHRKISVAQMDGFQQKAKAVGRVSFERLSYNQHPDGKLELNIQLSFNDREATGVQSAYVGKRGRLKIASEATVDALRQLFQTPIGIVVEDVARTEIAGEEIIHAAITLSRGPQEELMVGSAVVSQSDLEATVKATLDAVNRRMHQFY